MVIYTSYSEVGIVKTFTLLLLILGDLEIF